MPEKFTPEEYENLSNSPADAPYVEGDPAKAAEEAPDGVVERPGDEEET